MSNSVFVESRFWLLVVFSFVLPVCIYATLLAKRAISRNTVLLLGVTLVVTAGVDVYLLQHLAATAKATPSLADDAIFLSEVTLALYLLPAMFGGIGVNMLSHVLVRHLAEAESRFERAQNSSKRVAHGEIGGRAAIGSRPRGAARESARRNSMKEIDHSNRSRGHL